MKIGNTLYRSMLMILLSMCFFSCTGTAHNASVKSDTSILAAYDHPLLINSDTPFCQVNLVSSGKKLSAGKKILLLFDDPLVLQNPDGVYEVYVTREKIDLKNLSSSNPGYINVLDLYALTVTDPPNYLSIDLTKKSVQWAKDGQALAPLIMTILFRGNTMPDNLESKNAGQMKVQRIRVVQE